MLNKTSLLLFLACSVIGAAPIKHKFVVLDEGAGNLLYVNEFDSTGNWSVPIGKGSPRDMQLIGKNRVLIGHGGGYLEFDLANGKILKTSASFSGTTSARRQANGHTLITGVNLNGSTGVVVLDVDSLDVVKSKIVYPGDYVRLMRQTSTGTFLFGRDTMIQEGNSTGTFFWKAVVPSFSHAWMALREPSGNTLISAGYGAFMVEVDKSGTVVRKFGDKTLVPTAVHPYFYAMFQLLKNGDVVVANWQGHGTGHGASGVQILEFDPTGAIVWQWSRADLISSVQGVLIIDSLNTNVVCDERNGIMEPLTPTETSHNVHSAPNGSSPIRLVSTSKGMCIAALTDKEYSVTILSTSGRSVARFTGRGTGLVPMGDKVSASGVYLVKIAIDNQRFEQRFRIIR